MLAEKNPPFELHITTGSLLLASLDNFIRFCTNNGAKALLIELSRGECILQPMLNKIVYFRSLKEALREATELSDMLRLKNINTYRTKIEVPASYSEVWGGGNDGFAPYFEWHGKIRASLAPELKLLCEQHGAHLSLNSLKKEQDRRFVTVREFGDKAVFEQRVRTLSAHLYDKGWGILKEVSEYCIYDSNVSLDKGWLSQ